MVMGSYIVASSIIENCKCDPKRCKKSENFICYSCKKLVISMEDNKNLDNKCLSNSLASQSQLSSISTIANCSQLSSIPSMEEKKSIPKFVYYRRKPHTKSVSSAQSSARVSDGSLSNISSEVQKCSNIISLESSNGCFGDEKALCCVNDSYSSSKSNEELVSIPLRAETDENGECSSSDNLSERDLCISIIRNQWTINGIWPFKAPNFKTPGTNSDSGSMRICKVCEIQERSVEMLICDHCDEAFHFSCCNVKKIPFGEWFCCFCLKKKHRILMRNNHSDMSRFEENIGPIASMLIGIGSYISSARIGQQFQADVPDWSGPSFDEVDVIDEPVELDPLECTCLHGQNDSKLPRISSIGNWVQCRQVIEGMGDDVDGTICGKWRRAPLFEVQTDNWECFRSVLWDPSRADCSVPQELDTGQVLKQLKYIEMLRPRLTAKRCKRDQAKDVCTKQNPENSKKTLQNP